MLRLVFLLTVISSSVAFAQTSQPPGVLLPAYQQTNASRPNMAYASAEKIYLLVWQADRNERADVVGLRLDKAGKPLDAKPFVISAAKDTQERPRVASDGKGFLVIWQDLRNGKDFDVYAARVDAAGKVLDAAGVLVGGGDLNQCDPSVCFDGVNYQVLWRGYSGERSEFSSSSHLPASGYYVYGRRVSPAGRPVENAAELLARPPREYITPRALGVPAAISTGQGKLLAAARSGTTLCLWRMTNGKVEGEPILVPKSGCFDGISMATDGKNVLISWTTWRDTGGRSEGASQSGMILLPADADLKTAAAKPMSPMKDRPYVRHPAVAWDGAKFVVSWDIPMRGKDGNRFEAVFLRRLAADGSADGDHQAVVNDPASPAYWPALASDGAGLTLLARERHPADTANPIRIELSTIRR